MARLDARFALAKTLSSGDVPLADRRKIRMAMWTNARARQQILDMVEMELEAAGFLENIDWEKVMDFIIELIPVILQIMMLFLDDGPPEVAVS